MKLKAGMKIKISKDPSKSINLYGGRIHKLKIAGTTQIIHRVESRVVLIRYLEMLWTFHLDDIEKLEENITYIKPVTFNPKNLFL